MTAKQRLSFVTHVVSTHLVYWFVASRVLSASSKSAGTAEYASFVGLSVCLKRTETMIDAPALRDLLLSGHVLVYDDHRGWSLYEHLGLETLGECVLSRKYLETLTRDAPGLVGLYEEAVNG